MNSRKILAGFVFILVVLILFAVFFGLEQEGPPLKKTYGIEIKKIDRTGDFVYAVLDNTSIGTMDFIFLNRLTEKNIYVIRERGLGYEKFEEFLVKAKALEQYGYIVSETDPFFIPSDGIFIIPTGAMPRHIIENFEMYNQTEIIYLGKKDLVLESEIKQENWYNENYSRVIIKETDLPTFLENNDPLFDEILEDKWQDGKRERIEANKTNLVYLNMSSFSYVRVIYLDKNGTKKVVEKKLPIQELSLQYVEALPGDEIKYEFVLNKTNGTAEFILTDEQGNKTIEKLGRVVDQNFFSKRIIAGKSGEFVVKVVDEEGIVGGGILHIKKVDVGIDERYGRSIILKLNIDGQPVKNEEVDIWLNNSTERKRFSISEGKILVRAKLQKGTNYLHLEYGGNIYSIELSNYDDEIIETYLKYGVPGLLLVMLIYFWARVMKRPTYLIKITEAPAEKRKEVLVKSKEIMELFEKAKKEFDINEPLTIEEITSLIKKYLTDGLEVSEGNIEEILKRMEEKKIIYSYKRYYSTKKKDIRKEYLKREIKEGLIGKGIEFRIKGDAFVTRDYEVGFLSSTFSKRAIVVFENEYEKEKALERLNQKQLSRLKVQEFNKKVELITLSELGGFL
ncbi:MAG TPA: hypothetical protein VI912_00520 [Candidatus Bilamarchaeaceae archaeon]|nr:hypothetical protein [Candidatus Bilamarchaeaceae archaeon]